MKALSLLTDFKISRKKDTTLIVEKSSKQIKNTIENILPKQLKSTKFKVENSIFRAKTRISIFSWGETIEIKMTDIDNYKTQLSISSKSSLTTTLIDYGKNAMNIQEIILAIESAV